MSKYDREREAKEGLASDLTRANPQEARALTGGKKDRIDSDTAERIARDVATKRDREQKGG